MMVSALQAFLWPVILVALTCCVLADIRDRLIPNGCVAAIAICALILAVAERGDTLWMSIVAAIALFLAFGVASHFEIIGGGDVKLISASSLLMAPVEIGPLLLAIAISGGALSALYLAARSILNHAPAARTAGDNAVAAYGDINAWWHRERARIRDGGPMPYGVAIASGVIFTLIGGLSS